MSDDTQRNTNHLDSFWHPATAIIGTLLKQVFTPACQSVRDIYLSFALIQ